MKNRFLRLLFLFVFSVVFSFNFVGCRETPPSKNQSSESSESSETPEETPGNSPSDEPSTPSPEETPPTTPPAHTCNFGTQWVKDEEFHWHKCSVCGEISEKARHGTSNVCQVCYYYLPTEQMLTSYYTGHSRYVYDEVIETKTSKATRNDEYKLPWYDMADNQFSVVAQDILYRLTFIYGTERENTKEQLDSTYNRYKFVVSDIDRIAISGYNAYVLPELMLTNHIEEDECSHNNNACDLTCNSCLQIQMKNFTTDNTNLLYNESNLNLSEAISGKYTTINGTSLSNTENQQNAWNWYDSNLTDLTYESYANKYLNNFKMALAEIVSEKTITANYNKEAYDNLINRLVTIDVAAHKAQIISFIKNTVIGTQIVEADSLIGNTEYYTENNYTIDSTFANVDGQQSNNAKLYKAYDIIIDSILNQTLTNQYRDYEGDDPIKNNYTVNKITKISKGVHSNYLPNNNNELVYSHMVLFSKANNTPPTTIRGLISSSTGVDKTLSIVITVVVNGEQYTETRNVTLTSSEQNFDINIAQLTNGASFGAYRADSLNPVDNYILINFNNLDCVQFNISFLRMLPAE